MTRRNVSAVLAGGLALFVLIMGCAKDGGQQEGVSRRDVDDVAKLLADTAGGVNVRPEPQQLPPRMVFTREDIPREGGYLQVTIGDVTDDQANRFMRRLKSEPCTCGCPHTIDQCLIEDPQCDVAHRLAGQVIKEVTQGS